MWDVCRRRAHAAACHVSVSLDRVGGAVEDPEAVGVDDKRHVLLPAGKDHAPPDLLHHGVSP